MTEPMTDSAKKALEKHAEGYNCAQAVSCLFYDKTGMDEATMFLSDNGFIVNNQ